MNIKIKGFQGTSLIDYPEKISSIIFTGGCNFRCPMCHNPELVFNIDRLPDISVEEIFSKIEKRKKFIDAVVITGGEPMLYPDIIEFSEKLKGLGLLVKIDTNGSFPNTLKNIVNKKSVDYIAMDIKSSFEKYRLGAGTDIDTNKIYESIKTIINNFNGKYEFRITVVPEIVTKEDILSIREMINGAKKVVLQQFRNKITLDPDYGNIPPYPPDHLREIGDLFNGYVGKVEYRGI